MIFTQKMMHWINPVWRQRCLHMVTTSFIQVDCDIQYLLSKIGKWLEREEAWELEEPVTMNLLITHFGPWWWENKTFVKALSVLSILSVTHRTEKLCLDSKATYLGWSLVQHFNSLNLASQSCIFFNWRASWSLSSNCKNLPDTETYSNRDIVSNFLPQVFQVSYNFEESESQFNQFWFSLSFLDLCQIR